MAWVLGSQRTPNKPLPEQEWERQMALQGFLEEDVAKAELFKFFRNNISIASNMLLGIDLYPYQHMVIKTMMERDYVLGVLGRGSAKSFMAGVFAATYALMNPNSKIGILSASFRQSKHIFKYVEGFSTKKEGALFRDCISNISKRNDDWTMTIGSSTITAVPLGDGEKLRGFRFTVILIDELLLMPSKILNEVILPFISVVPNPTERDKLKDAEDFLIKEGLMREEDRYIWAHNKLIGLSSASYAFEYLYELYQIYESLITGKLVNAKLEDRIKKNLEGGATRAIVHMSYEAMPKGLYEQSAIEQFQATMSESQFDRELRSIFTDDSSGFFKMSKMAACTIPDGAEPSIEIKGESGQDYLVAIDPSWAENDESDHFALQVFKLDNQTKQGTLVHSYARAGASLKEHIEYFLYILRHFNVVSVWLDYSGGSEFVNACNESSQFKDKGIKLGVVEEDFDGDERYQEALRNGKKQYSAGSKQMIFYRKFNSEWIRKGNEFLQANIDHKRIWFAGRCIDSTYQKQLSHNIDGIDSLQFYTDGKKCEESGKAKQIELIEQVADNIVLTKAECALIQVTSTPQGNQTFDLPQNIKRQSGPNRTRRDSYTSLVIGNWGVKVHFDILGAEKQTGGEWTPTMV